jgi:biotin synthase
MDVEKIVAEARKAKASGATRYCMGAGISKPSLVRIRLELGKLRHVHSIALKKCQE